MLTNYAMMN